MSDRLAEIEQEFHRTRDGVRHCLGHEYNEWLIEEVKRRGQMIDRITIERGQAIQTARQIKAEAERLQQQHERDLQTIGTGSRANAELEIENERLREANSVLGQYLYSVHNPGSLPMVVRSAMSDAAVHAEPR